jgi:hypothetical protein
MTGRIQALTAEQWNSFPKRQLVALLIALSEEAARQDAELDALRREVDGEYPAARLLATGS